MKKTLSFVVTLLFIASSLGLVSCSGDSSTERQGTTTGGLDIGIASDAATDTAATDTDTLGTTTE